MYSHATRECHAKTKSRSFQLRRHIQPHQVQENADNGNYLRDHEHYNEYYEGVNNFNDVLRAFIA